MLIWLMCPRVGVFLCSVQSTHLRLSREKKWDVDVQAIGGRYGAEGEVTDKLEQLEIHEDLNICFLCCFFLFT